MNEPYSLNAALLLRILMTSLRFSPLKRGQYQRQQGGWHSHRIDLSDHGRRDTNYLEMLEWSRISYWLTMRFVPGAINRWRAGKHLNKMEGLGLKVLHEGRTMRDVLPIPQHRLSSEFIALDDDELRTEALDVVARKVGL